MRVISSGMAVFDGSMGFVRVEAVADCLVTPVEMLVKLVWRKSLAKDCVLALVAAETSTTSLPILIS